MSVAKKTMEERLVEMVEKNGILSFVDFEKKFGKKPSEMLNKKKLDEIKLRITRLGGEKVLALSNKTKTILAIIESKGRILNGRVYELNDWNSHVTGSVFRQSARDKFGIVKVNKELVKK